MDTINGSVGKNVRVLFSQAPQLEGNVQRQMEESFWRRVSRDTLKSIVGIVSSIIENQNLLLPNLSKARSIHPLISLRDLK